MLCLLARGRKESPVPLHDAASCLPNDAISRTPADCGIVRVGEATRRHQRRHRPQAGLQPLQRHARGFGAHHAGIHPLSGSAQRAHRYAGMHRKSRAGLDEGATETDIPYARTTGQHIRRAQFGGSVQPEAGSPPLLDEMHSFHAGKCAVPPVAQLSSRRDCPCRKKSIHVKQLFAHLI